MEVVYTYTYNSNNMTRYELADYGSDMEDMIRVGHLPYTLESIDDCPFESLYRQRRLYRVNENVGAEFAPWVLKFTQPTTFAKEHDMVDITFLFDRATIDMLDPDIIDDDGERMKMVIERIKATIRHQLIHISDEVVALFTAEAFVGAVVSKLVEISILDYN